MTYQGHLVYSLDTHKIVDAILPEHLESIFSDHKWAGQKNLLITLAEMNLTDLPGPFKSGGWTSDRFRKSEWIGFDLDDLSYEGELNKELVGKIIGEWAGTGRWLVVHSGNGLHVWCKVPPVTSRKWYLKKKEAYSRVAVELQEKLEEAGIKVKADTQVFRPNLSFRLPGTVNVKKGKYQPVYILVQNKSDKPCSKVRERIEDWHEALEIESTFRSSSPFSFQYRSYDVAQALLNTGIKHKEKSEGRTAILGACPYCGKKHKAYVTRRGKLRCLRQSCEANNYKQPGEWLQKIGIDPDLYKGIEEVSAHTSRNFIQEFEDVGSFRESFTKVLPDFLDFLKDNPETVPLVATTPGSGKSSSIRRALELWLQKTQVAQRVLNSEGKIEPDYPTVWFILPTHKLAKETAEHFEELGIKVCRLKGRGHFRDTDCEYPGSCEINDVLGCSSSRVCNYCSKGPNNQWGEYCAYYKQLFEAASSEPGSVVITTSAQWYSLLGQDIFIPGEPSKRPVMANASMFIFDECPEDGHQPTQIVYRDKNPTEKDNIQSLIFRDCWPDEAKTFAEVFYQFLSPKPDINLSSALSWRVWCNKDGPKRAQGGNLKRIMTSLGIKIAGSNRKWRKLLRKVSELRPGLNRDKEDKKVTVHSLPAWVPKAAEFLLNSPERVCVHRRDGQKIKTPEAMLTLFEQNSAEPERYIGVDPETGEGGEVVQVPCLILDAYGETSLADWQRLFHKRKVELQACKIKSDPNKVEVLWQQYNTSRAALKNEEKYSKAKTGLERQIQNLDRSSAIYTHKASVERVRQELRDYGDKVRVDHYGSGRGINTYSGRNIILFGEARQNEFAIEAALYAATGKKPDPHKVSKKSVQARYRAYMEAVYRSRPLDSPETGLKIVIFSYDRPPPELVYGVRTSKARSYGEQDIAEVLNQFKMKYGWIPTDNFLKKLFSQEANDFHNIPELYNLLYKGLGDLVVLKDKNSREQNRKAFKHVEAGMKLVRVADFGYILVDQKSEISPAEIVESFCNSYGFKIPTWARKLLLVSGSQNLSEVVSNPSSEVSEVQSSKAKGEVVDFPKREPSKKAYGGRRKSKIPRIDVDWDRIQLSNCS